MKYSKMAQQNLAMDAMDISNAGWEYVDAVPTHLKIKKKILVNNEWKDQVYVQIDRNKNVETWLRERYTNQGYLKDWWLTSNSAIMTDQIYVFWKLCE